MAPVNMAELERIASLAKTMLQPLDAAWRSVGGVSIELESPQAERSKSSDIASNLSGSYWLLPVEVTGVHNGVACILLPHLLDPADTGEGLVLMIDEFLAAASDRLTASLGGPISLDRLGLRESPAGLLAGGLIEALGTGDLVGVRFPAMASDGSRIGDVLAVFGGRLLRELSAVVSEGGETLTIEPEPVVEQPGSTSAVSTGDLFQDLLIRARGLELTMSVELGRKTVKLGDLVRLRPGSMIDMGKSVTQPLEMWVGPRQVADVDAVVLEGRLGAKLRGR